jgi:hypothetical protein
MRDKSEQTHLPSILSPMDSLEIVGINGPRGEKFVALNLRVAGDLLLEISVRSSEGWWCFGYLRCIHFGLRLRLRLRQRLPGLLFCRHLESMTKPS